MLGEKAARQVGVFGGEPHLALVAQPECGRDVIEIGHVAHVDPGLRHGDDDIGETEAEPRHHDDAPVRLRDHLAHQILAGDAEMHGALAELLGDLGRRQISHLDAVEAGDGAAIVAGAARLDQFEAGAGKKASAFCCSRPFDGTARRSGARVHAAPPHAVSSSIEAAKPTAGIGARAPSRVSRPS